MAQSLILVTSVIRSKPDNMAILKLEDIFAQELHFLKVDYIEDGSLYDVFADVSARASVGGVETLSEVGQVFTGEEALAYLKSLPSTEFEQIDCNPLGN